MRRFVYQLVERLGDPDSGLTRNRHFALLSSPSGKRALKLHRHLQSLADDLARHGKNAKLSVREESANVVVTLEIAPLKLVRTAVLTRDDVDVLVARRGPLADALAPFARGTP